MDEGVLIGLRALVDAEEALDQLIQSSTKAIKELNEDNDYQKYPCGLCCRPEMEVFLFKSISAL